MAEMHSVMTRHAEYNLNIERWIKISKALNGDVKKYLRDVGASEPDAEYAKVRQDDYADGAVYLNFTKRTLSGVVGSVMRKAPEIQLPDAMQYLLDDCDGFGVGLVQQAKDTLSEDSSLGRAFLLADAPNTEAANRAQQNAGKLNPRILMYTAINVINWKKDLSRVVLRETYEYQNSANEFETMIGQLYRVCEVVDGYYRQRVYKFDDKLAQLGEEEIYEPRINGQRMRYIPGAFIGAINNDSTVDAPPFETLADVNIGHYRNSADVEEGAFICSQPTLMLYPGENMSTDRFAEANPNGIRLGSRMGHLLGAGGASELLQAQPSNLSRELMADKEEQAIKVGAQLITPSAQITAESARLQRGADTSIMATVAMNVSDAYEKVLGYVAEMLRTGGEIVFELNTEFFMQPMTAQDRAAWIADINAGLMPARAYRAALRAAGVTNWEDAEIEGELEKQPPPPAPEINTEVIGEIPQAVE